MKKRNVHWSFSFLNNGKGAILLKDKIYEFVFVDGRRILGKLLKKIPPNQVVIKGENKKKEEVTVHRTTVVYRVDPSVPKKTT